MCSYTASTLAIRAKCSLSFHYLCLPNDQPFCCHHPCCQFSVSPRFFSGYLLGLSSQFHSKVLFHAGRRRLRVFYRSRDFDMMGLLAEPEERFTGLGEPDWRKARREIPIESIEGERRSSRKEEITGICSPTRSDVLSSVCDPEHNKVGRGRAGGNSQVRYVNRKKDTGYNEVDVAEEEVRDVHKYVDDSWRERRYFSKRDVNLDSRKDESTTRYGSFRHLGVKKSEEKTVHCANLSQQGNLRESGLDGRSKKVTKIPEAQLDDELDNAKRTSVSTNVRKIEKESSASAARQNGGMDHQVAWHDKQRRSLVEQSKAAEFRYNNAQSAAYRQRDFEETSIRGREERAHLEQNLSRVSRGKRIHFHRHALEQDESRRSTDRLNEVSLSRGSDFERTSPIDGKSVNVIMDAIPNLAHDSSQESRDKRSQMEMELHLSVENMSEESEDKLIIAGNSIQLKGGERKQIDKGPFEHDRTRRNSQMLGEVSEVYSVKMEALSLSRENKGKSYSVQSSIPAKKDKGTQVEMHDAYYDQIEMPGFNANNIVNATSSWNSPASRVDIKEYSPLLASNQISSIRKQNVKANEHAYLLYDAQREFERSASEFDLQRSNNIRISNANERYNSRTENEKAFISAETSSYVLTQEQEEQRSSLTGESSQPESMKMTSTGSLRTISSPQQTCSELNYDAGWGYQKGQYDTTNYSTSKLEKSSSSLASEFVDRLQKEVVALKESGKTPNVSVGIQVGKPGRRDFQSTLRIENRNETSSTVLTQERKERLSSLLVADKSPHKARKIASTGSLGDVSSSVKIYSEVDNHSGRDDIRYFTHDTVESVFTKSSVFGSDEFVDEIQQEKIFLNESGNEPSLSSRIQIEETGRSQSEGIAFMQVGERSDSREHGDDRHIKEGGRLSSSGSGMRGPSDEMWGDEIQSSQETSNAEEPEENSPTSEAVDLTAPTLENSITRRSPKSLWSFLADIIQMSWILRRNSPSSTLKSGKRASSNESLSSETWFSGPEPDEDGAGDESPKTKQIGLLKDSGAVTGSVELPLQELKKGDSLAVIEPDSSISSGFMTSGLSARTASSSVEADNTQYSKSSQGTLSNVVIVEQQLESALPSTSGIIESRVRDKVKVLKQSASYPAAVMRVGFSSAITQETSAEQTEAAQVGKGDNSSLEIYEPLLSSTVDSALPRITDTEEVDRPGIIPMLELDPFGDKLPQVGGIKETGIKQRKFQRNKQVPSEQFDEWEKAFKLENEQKKLDEFFMREAILDAKKGSDAWEVPVGAVLVQNGKIIARGCNMVEELRDSTAHAEMICIREASNLLRSWRLAETTLYATLEPCPMCAGAILQARIDTVVWGAPNRLLGADGSWVRLFPAGDGESSSMNPPSRMTGPVHPFHPNIKIRRGVLETECADVMQQFFKLRRKKEKKPESSPPPSYLPLSNRPVKFFSKLHNIFCMMFCL